MQRFDDLTERETLALAISSEEEDGRIYRDFAETLRPTHPETAGLFDEMATQEESHRRALLELYAGRFGRHIPLIRRDHIRGAPRRAPAWRVMAQGIEAIRRHAQQMEADAGRFYLQAAGRSGDTAARRLLGDLAAAEGDHLQRAGAIADRRLNLPSRQAEDQAARRRLVLQIVQPGLVGLMDGSISTLAPVFAAAFATREPRDAFIVGLAASLGAGISMGFAEALADDGKLSGRGRPLLRGLVCGLMTALGGLGHTLPFLIPHFRLAVGLAGAATLVELAAITWVQARFMDTPPLSAAAKVVLGGALVVATGILIGSG